MATPENISPELLALLRQMEGSRTGHVDGGNNYNSLTSYGEGEFAQTPVGGGGWAVDAVGSDPRNGDYQEFNKDGVYVADREKRKDKSVQDFMTFLGGALGAYGIGTAMAGAAGGMGGLGGSLDLGMGAAHGGYEGFLTESLAQNAAMEAAAGGAATGAATGAANAASSTPGLFDSVKSFLPEGVKSYLGPAATLAGGLLGAKGNEQTQSVNRQMDQRLDGPVYGPGGIVHHTQGLLAKQMAPEYQRAYDDLRNKGIGLLQQPIAGNGFARFTGRN